MTIQVIGDVLHFDGYAVGRISSSLNASTRDRLEECLDTAYIETEYDKKEKERDGNAEFRTELLADLRERFAKLAEAGLIEVSELETVLQEYDKVSA